MWELRKDIITALGQGAGTDPDGGSQGKNVVELSMDGYLVI